MLHGMVKGGGDIVGMKERTARGFWKSAEQREEKVD